jgi:hypothetical protein
MFEVHQVKVHIFGILKCLQQRENVDTVEVNIYNIIYNKMFIENLRITFRRSGIIAESVCYLRLVRPSFCPPCISSATPCQISMKFGTGDCYVNLRRYFQIWFNWTNLWGT